MSPKSGCIFEKRLVELYIAATGRDPVSEDSLTVDELIVVKSKDPVIVPPKPAAFNSIPTMLQAFQNEWDALALETFTLRKQLQNTRQELSASLYQYDAAVRVANNALKERDEAREALAELSKSFAQSSKDQSPEAVKTNELSEPNDRESVGLASDRQNEGQIGQATEKTPEAREGSFRPMPKYVAQDLLDASQRLFAQHKNLKITARIPGPRDKVLGTRIANEISNPYRAIVVASNGRVAIYNKNAIYIYPDGKVIRKKAPILSICFTSRGDQVLVACANNLIYFHNIDGSTVRNVIHSGPDIRQIMAHPSLPMTIATRKDRWAVFYKNQEAHDPGPILDNVTCQALHVDGRLLAVGTMTGKVMIYDIVTIDKVASIDTRYPLINKLQFAYNGYWLVVGSYLVRGLVQLFDLRKNLMVQEFEYNDRVEFSIDKSSQVLAASVKKDMLVYFSFYDKKAKSWMVDLKKYAVSDEAGILLLEHLHEDTDRPRFIGMTRNNLIELEMSEAVE